MLKAIDLFWKDYPERARTIADITKYSRSGLIPMAIGVAGLLLWWWKKKREKLVRPAD